MNIQGWFTLGLTDLISLLSKGLSRSSPAPQFKSINSLVLSFLSGPTLTSMNGYGKTIALLRGNFVGKVMSLLFNMLSRFVIVFLPRSKVLLISWLQSPSAVILEPEKIKSVTVSIVSPSIYHEVRGPDAMILVFWILSLSQCFYFSSSLLSAIRVLLSAYLRLLIFLLAIFIPACDSPSLVFCMMYSV